MLSIGDFARYAGLSVRVLRHYDELGLLRPARVDATTGYRWYAATQFPRVNRLVALKGLGFSLDEVGRILDGGLTAEELRGMLRLRQEELESQMAADRARLAEVGARLRSIEKEHEMPTMEFTPRDVDAVRLATLSQEVGSMEEIGPAVQTLFERLREVLTAASVTLDRPAQAVYDAGPGGVRITVGWPTSRADVPGAEVVDVPACRALSLIHRGDFTDVGESWQALEIAADERGLTGVGPGREVYHHLDGAPTDWVTELLRPIRDATDDES